MLAPELADICEVGGGSVSTDAIGGDFSTVEVFEFNDTVCPAAEACVEVGWAAPVELGVGEPSSALLSAVDPMVSGQPELATAAGGVGA